MTTRCDAAALGCGQKAYEERTPQILPSNGSLVIMRRRALPLNGVCFHELEGQAFDVCFQCAFLLLHLLPPGFPGEGTGALCVLRN